MRKVYSHLVTVLLSKMNAGNVNVTIAAHTINPTNMNILLPITLTSYIRRFLLSLVLMIGLAGLSYGQVVWSGAASCVSGSGATWLTANNWCSAAIPATGQIAQFGANGSATTVGFNMNGASTAQKTIGVIEIASTNTVARIINNSSTTVTGSMIFTGATVNSISNVILRNASSILLSLNNGASQNFGVTLGNATNNIINIDGTGGITIVAPITEAAAG